MGTLPTARTITLAPGDPIPSALLNELQDNIIGTKRPTWTRISTPIWIDQGPWVPPPDAPLNEPFGWTSTNAGGDARFTIPYEVGDRLLTAKITRIGNAADDCTWRIYYSASIGATATLLSLTLDTNPAAAWADLSLTAFTAQTIGANGFLWFNNAPSGTVYQFSRIVTTWDRL